MADTKQPDIQDKDKKETPVKPLRNKSYREILVDNAKRQSKESPEEKPKKEVEEKPEVAKLEEKAEEIKETKKKEDTTDKFVEVAKETINQTFKEKEEEYAKRLEEEEKKKARDAKKVPPWRLDPNRPKDSKGNPLPTDYDEIWGSAKEAAKEEILEEMDRREAAREAKRVEEEKAKQTQEQQNQDMRARMDSQVDEEVKELYNLNKLPAIKDAKDPNDEGELARQDFFKFAMEFNDKRIKEGKPVMFPLQIMNYYQPKAKEPAGNNAPVMGNAHVRPEESENKINFREIRNKSYRQILSEGLKRIRGS